MQPSLHSVLVTKIGACAPSAIIPTMTATRAQAIVFDAPRALSVRTLELQPFEAGDLEVEVSVSGISTGTERLLWDGAMPPFPGLGYPLGPGYETPRTVVRAGARLAVPLAGFYKSDLSVAFAPAFMRAATLRIAAQWKKHDLQAVTALVEQGRLSLDGLIMHTLPLARAQEADEVAFGDPRCLKMMLDWKA